MQFRIGFERGGFDGLESGQINLVGEIAVKRPGWGQLACSEPIEIDDRLLELQFGRLLALAGIDDFGIGLDQFVFARFACLNAYPHPLLNLLQQQQRIARGD